MGRMTKMTPCGSTFVIDALGVLVALGAACAPDVGSRERLGASTNAVVGNGSDPRSSPTAPTRGW